MSKIYNIAFRMGVLFNILLFTILNIITFVDRRNDFIAMENSGMFWSGVDGVNWGFPFPMFKDDMLFDERSVVINASIYVICGFFFGFLFKFIWSKIPHRAHLN